MTDLRASKHDDVTTLELNRPERLNALTAELLEDLIAALDRAEKESRAIVITGATPAFCSGADLSSAKAGSSGIDLKRVTDLMNQLYNLNIPTIAAVGGAAAGFGCSLALACDYSVVSSKAFFMLAFTRVGLMPDSGATALVTASIGRHRAMKMALTGERIYGEEAVAIGLASEVAADQDHLRTAQLRAGQFAQGATLALERTKHAINATSIPKLDDALERESQGQSFLHSTNDYIEGVSAFSEKRKPVFSGN